MPIKKLIEQADTTLSEKLAERTDLTPSEAFDLPRAEVLTRLFDAMTIEELKALPEVASNEHAKKNRRDDLIAAARGEMVEAEREEAARKLAEQENQGAPSREDVDLLNLPPGVEVVMNGSEVEEVIITRWEMDSDTRRPVKRSERRRP
jgi:hypothetical protein